MKVAVIGAGISGLVSIKSCIEENLEPICFEQENSLGGLWNFTEDERHSTVYRSTVINTCKEMSCFSDFPISREYPMFMPHTYVMKYLHLYATHFDLYQYIRLNTTVIRVHKTKDHELTGKWRVQYKEASMEVKSEVFDAVVVCIGHHWCPYLPSFPGIDMFEGKKMHSHSYKDHQGLQDKTVLVVGFGNSAADIATELSHHASKVFLSTRRGGWVISRLANRGVPWDFRYETRLLNFLPAKVSEWLFTELAQGKFDHGNFGLSPKQSISSSPTVISDELPHRIANGSLVIKPNVSQFTSGGVVFQDGDVVDNLDAVIFCTGYDVVFSFLDQDTVSVHDNEVTLYKYMFPPHHNHSTLAIIGLTQSSGSMIPLIEIQARWAVRVFAGKCTLPCRKEMMEDIESKREQIRKTFYYSKRLTLQVSSIAYKDEIADLIGCKPSMWKLLFTDPVLAYYCFIGPCTPPQYRLTGPHIWPGAREAIAHARDSLLPRNCAAFATASRCDGRHPSSSTVLYKAALIITIGVLFCQFSNTFIQGGFMIDCVRHETMWLTTGETTTSSSSFLHTNKEHTNKENQTFSQNPDAETHSPFFQPKDKLLQTFKGTVPCLVRMRECLTFGWVVQKSKDGERFDTRKKSSSIGFA